MLTFEEKIKIIDSFSDLDKKEISLGRVNYHYENSAIDKKIVVYHLHPNGNGFVYAGKLQGYPSDEKGFVNIRDYAPNELRSLIEQSIRSLTIGRTESQQGGPSPQSPIKNINTQEEHWVGPNHQSLLVKYEDDLWYIYANDQLEAAFESYQEVEIYMEEEGFSLRRG